MKLLRVFAGPMSAGKTTDALQVARRYARQNMNVILVRPSLSRRSFEKRPGILSTKAGEDFPSIDLSKAQEISYACELADVVWIDEPAIFPDEERLVGIVTELRKTKIILISGLSATSELEPFGTSMPKLIAMADQVCWASADCDLCGTHATATRSLYIGEAPKTVQVQVGGEESYVPACADCWTQLMLLEPHSRRAYLLSAGNSASFSKTAS
jgi:thymidine kinase